MTVFNGRMTGMTTPKSLKVFLIQAVYHWCVDQGYTPYLGVKDDEPGVSVPPGYSQEGITTLNVAPRAVHDWQTTATGWTFDARFQGESVSIRVPFHAIMAIYARETGQGLFMSTEPGMGGIVFGPDEVPDDSPEPPTPKVRAGFRVIKGQS